MRVDVLEGDDPTLRVGAFMPGVRLQKTGESEEDDAGRKKDTEVEM